MAVSDPVANVRSSCDPRVMKRYQRSPIAKLVMILMMLAISACAEGWEASRSEAREWLPENLPYLQRVIVLLGECHPMRENGYHTIWVDGSNDDVALQCKFGSDAQIAEIRTELRKANVLGVAQTPTGHPGDEAKWANFILHRSGMVTSGSMTSIDFSSQSKPCLKEREGDENYQVLHYPLTPEPCQWFWTRSAN